MLVDEILARIKNKEDLEQILKEYNWQTFEEFVAWIFQQFNYQTKIHTRFKYEGKIYEIDVLAEKRNKCFLVECKRWTGKSFAPSRILNAAKKHAQKIKAWSSQTKKNCEGIIVVLLDLPNEIEGIKIVPIYRLNYFLKTFG